MVSKTTIVQCNRCLRPISDGEAVPDGCQQCHGKICQRFYTYGKYDLETCSTETECGCLDDHDADHPDGACNGWWDACPHKKEFNKKEKS